jgi:tetratricopeptide (TPR) repeat protein
LGRPQPGGIWGNGSNNTNSGNTVLNRPVNSGNTVLNRPISTGNINTGNINSGNISNTTNNVYANQQNFVNTGNRYGGGNAWGGYRDYPGYYPRAYGGWYSGSWTNWPSYPAVWAGAATLGALGFAAADNFSYSNPYATTLTDQAYDYAQPIPAYVESNPAETTVNVNIASDSPPDQVPPTPGVVDPSVAAPAAQPPDQAPADEDPKVKKAIDLFDQARELFKGGDYVGAQIKVDKAVGVLPQDRVLHEFRALVLFARRKYAEAAAALYAVLAAGPGWNWDTLKSFYPDVDTYTRQLRVLEADARDKPNSAEDRLVLAYHYLGLGQKDAAVKELEKVNQLQPGDHLSAQILAALKPKREAADDRPEPASG